MNLSLFIAIISLGLAILSLHRNAVLSNEVGKCKMVEIGLQHRLDRLEAQMLKIERGSNV